MEWSEETISRLRSLWQEGLSTAEIGRRLSITKNAVVGKAHRLTLPPRPSPIRPAVEGAPRREPGPRAARPAPTPQVVASLPAEPVVAAPGPTAPPASVTHPVTQLRIVPAPVERAAPEGRRRGQSCCWPLGEPGTKQFRFCGGEPMQGKPYCAEHAQLAYVKLRDRRDTVA